MKQYRDTKAWVLYIIYIFLMIFTISNKKSLHVDETFTYGLSNNTIYDSISMVPEEGVQYTPAAKPFLDYLTVQKGEQFNYINVWKKNIGDVHPPIYYAIIHTICSLFPESFSIWYAAVVNILFSLCNLFLLRAILKLLISDNKAILIASIGYIALPELLNITAFFRMYILLTFWILALIYVSLLKLNNRMRDRTFFSLLWFISAFGVLTQYFMAIFLVGFCMVWLSFFIRQKELKKIVFFCYSMIAAIVTVLGLFPWCIFHVFGGYRGNDVVQNLVSSSVVERYRSFGGFVNAAILGNSGGLIVIFVLSFSVACIYKMVQQRPILNWKKEYTVIIIPTIIYFLFVAKVVPLVDQRYITPIYPVVFILFVCLITYLIDYLIKNKKIYYICLTLILLLCVINGWRTCNWSYLYKSQSSLVDFSQKNQELDCLFIYNDSDDYWIMQKFFMEIKNYNSLEFVTYDTLATNNKDFSIADNTIVFVSCSCNKQDVLETLVELYQMTNVQVLDNNDYATAWLLSR